MPADHLMGDFSQDAQLVEAARGGDHAAFGELYGRYARMVHGVLLAHVPYAEVDDLVQDVFLVALSHLGSLREPRAFAGWLLAIARNRANDFHRRPRAAQEFQGWVVSNDPDEQEARAALAAIHSLPEAYRETLSMRLVEGMTGPEIAARTGMTPASVRVNLHRGMKQLRAKLGKSANHE
ncbi:MAG TPA: sigma-70 family RNA polymerase sigma factor [Candidatus Acidoferrales bacterium]|nr:sigma-70 family RNA polymerase sigma factor [Candidatus Acidoferrales bacterium]